MRAATAHAAPAVPVQASLVAEEPQPPLVEYAIWGHLVRDAELRIDTGGWPHVLVEVRQPKDKLAFVAMLHANQSAVEDLRILAGRLVAGAPVLVRCRGFELATHRGVQVLRALICDGVSPAQFTPVHPEDVQ